MTFHIRGQKQNKTHSCLTHCLTNCVALIEYSDRYAGVRFCMATLLTMSLATIKEVTKYEITITGKILSLIY